MSITVEHWGTIDYQQAWDRQTVLFDEIINQKIANQATTSCLVFCEHPHVYTLGKSGHSENM